LERRQVNEVDVTWRRHEVDVVLELKRIDLPIAGGASSGWSLEERVATLRHAKAGRYLGARAIGV